MATWVGPSSPINVLGLAACQWCDGDGCEHCGQTGTIILYRESQYKTAKESGILICDCVNAARA